jgi:hypothetical protein
MRKTKLKGGVIKATEGTSQSGNPIIIVEQEVTQLKESYVSQAMKARGVRPQIEEVTKTRKAHLSLMQVDQETGELVLDEAKKEFLLGLDGKDSYVLCLTSAEFPVSSNLEMTISRDRDTNEVIYSRRGFPLFSRIDLLPKAQAFDIWMPYVEGETEIFEDTLEKLAEMNVNIEAYK